MRFPAMIGRSMALPERTVSGRQARSGYAALLVFAGYYLGAELGLALTFGTNPISVLWPPNAILFAALLLTSRYARGADAGERGRRRGLSGETFFGTCAARNSATRVARQRSYDGR